MIGTKVSHYVIAEELGRGGMGVVYKAEDTRLRRFVALKFLSTDLSSDLQAVERFQREARAASGLNHPHICAVYDVGEHDGRHFIVMELLEGAALHQRAAGQPVPIDEVLELGIQIADALDAAHARGIVHRDIKPANVFVTERGQAKLLDFGLAKPATARPAGSSQADGTTLEHLTSPGVVLGTVAYMSPEQVRGDNLDARTDLFSLGTVLYEMATGRQAFSGTTSGTVQEAILNRAPLAAARVNPELPPGLEEVINKALEKDGKLRYQSASELRTDLQRVKRDRDSARFGTASGSRVEAGAAARRRRTAAVSAAALAALIVLAGMTWFAFFRAQPETIDSIAVLPFVNGSGDPNAEYLSDGITESLINNLSQVDTLRVSARSAVFRYKGKDVDPQKAGQDLKVRAVLSGRLLQRDNRLVVRTELLDVSSGAQLWGHEYQSTSADVFVLQENLSREISQRLQLRLTSAEQQQLTKRHTENAEAFELYLRGLYHLNKLNMQDVQRAIGYFNQAVERDPRYALAYARLGDAYSRASFFNAFRPGDVMPKARAAASKALEIDGHLPEAHMALAYTSFTYDWDWTAATKHVEQARALSASAVANHPSYPFYLTVGRRHAEAIQAAERAIERDPLSAALSHNRAVQLALAKQRDAAIEDCRRTIELDASFAVAYEVMAASYAAQGMYREALPPAEKASSLNPASAMSLALVGYVRANLNRRGEAQQILEQLSALSRQRYIPALASAVVYAGLNEKDQAFAWLEKAYDERSNRLAYLGLEPTWERLHSDPRFENLLRRIGLPQ